MYANHMEYGQMMVHCKEMFVQCCYSQITNNLSGAGDILFHHISSYCVKFLFYFCFGRLSQVTWPGVKTLQNQVVRSLVQKWVVKGISWNAKNEISMFWIWV